MRNPLLCSFFLLPLVVFGCLGEPDRGNPLDPLSDNFDEAGAVGGFVTTYYPPFDGLASVRVLLTGIDDPTIEYSVSTSSSGQYSISGVATGSYRVEAEIDGYAQLADTVQVDLGRFTSLDLRLDGLPLVANHMVRTEHISRWFPSDDLYRLVVETGVDDPDGLGDISSVRFSVPDFNFSDTLAVTPGDPALYARTFEEAQLPTTLQDLLGRTLQIEVLDRIGNAGFAPSAQIVRIIDSTPLALSPTFPDPVGRQPQLTWRAIDLPFAFTYRVDIVLVPFAGQQTLVGSFGGLSPADTTWMVPTPLDAGDYSWTVSVEDVFGNRSRSKEAGFRVVSGSQP